jgi:hypothetical protein
MTDQMSCPSSLGGFLAYLTESGEKPIGFVAIWKLNNACRMGEFAITVMAECQVSKKIEAFG